MRTISELYEERDHIQGDITSLERLIESLTDELESVYDGIRALEAGAMPTPEAKQ